MTERLGSRAHVLECLSRVPLFAAISQSSARALAARCSHRELEKGQVLFLEADPAESVYVVLAGKIAILLNSPDGRELVMDELHAGEILGELGALTRKARSASAVARASSEVLTIPREAFARILDAEPCVARNLLCILAERLQKSATREMALAFLDAQARLARYLLHLEAQNPEAGYVTVSQEDLARGTGLIRQTVAKALGQWRRQGWLLTGRGRIVILNRKALERLQNGSVQLPPVSPK
ncbi:MAG: Crp/Fnr family transcriptional regulator [Anaerolineales bacterium]